VILVLLRIWRHDPVVAMAVVVGIDAEAIIDHVAEGVQVYG
jgi:hypothetical protein